MTNQSPVVAPTLPPLVAQMFALLLRHGLTGLAGGLASIGVLVPDDNAKFVSLATALVLGLAGLGWSLVSKLIARQKFNQALDVAPAGYVAPLKPGVS